MAPFSLAQWLQLAPPCWLEVHQALWGAPGARGQTRSKGFGTIVRAAQWSLHWPLLARKAWFLQTNIASKIIRTYLFPASLCYGPETLPLQHFRTWLCETMVLAVFWDSPAPEAANMQRICTKPSTALKLQSFENAIFSYLYQTFFTQSCFILLTSYLLLAISYILPYFALSWPT